MPLVVVWAAEERQLYEIASVPTLPVIEPINLHLESPVSRHTSPPFLAHATATLVILVTVSRLRQRPYESRPTRSDTVTSIFSQENLSTLPTICYIMQ